MLFNSLEFVFFLPLTFLLYWLVFQKYLKAQNIFLLLISYLFYGWWDWRFLSLILFSSVMDYLSGIQIARSNTIKRKKIFLWLSIVTNLSLLGFFKYFNFFAESFANMIALIGFQANPYSLNIILPVGISFYTFQTMSYTIDVYRGKMEPTKDLVAFMAYVSFFPQLVAGPIERAVNLLPQFKAKRHFTAERGGDGMRLILWGLFKKMVIADNCAIFVNAVFADYQSASVLELITGAIFFAFQIYGDFSGYSDIAIGTAKLLGIDLMINFRTPYFSRDIAEFWRRWHISLSTWFRDYVYIPLGGSKVGKSRAVFNTFLIFTVSGLWHGASWNFVVWGILNALYFLPLLLWNRNRDNLGTVAEGRHLPNIKELRQITVTFALTCLAWVFFRSENFSAALNYLMNMWNNPLLPHDYHIFELYLPVILSILILFEWSSRKNGFSQWMKSIKPGYQRTLTYFMLVYSIIAYGIFDQTQFIYFQF